MFRDALKSHVEFRLRPTLDLRSPRDAFRYQKAIERRTVLPALEPLGTGPLEPSHLGAPHPTPCACGECLNWWTQQDSDEAFINAACAANEQR